MSWMSSIWTCRISTTTPLRAGSRCPHKVYSHAHGQPHLIAVCSRIGPPRPRSVCRLGSIGTRPTMRHANAKYCTSLHLLCHSTWADSPRARSTAAWRARSARRSLEGRPRGTEPGSMHSRFKRTQRRHGQLRSHSTREERQPVAHMDERNSAVSVVRGKSRQKGVGWQRASGGRVLEQGRDSLPEVQSSEWLPTRFGGTERRSGATPS